MGGAEGFAVNRGDGSLRRAKAADIAVVGLAVMGENLVLNMASRGYTVAVYNRTTSKVDAFLAARAAGKSIAGAWSPEELVSKLARPRRVMLMVQAGRAVDRVIETLVPLLDPGDVLIDGGNSNYQDTTRRTRTLRESGILYVGTGVSGGEEGALLGPSIMPGGNPDAWPVLEPIFKAIAAKVDGDVPCCEWIGPDGAGHYVKMVHNGIEYGDMQMIAEAYSLLGDIGGFEPAAMSRIFAGWNEGELSSYLVEITAGDSCAGRRRDGPAAGRSHPRLSGAEGDGQVDGHRLADARRAGHRNHRGGVRACALRAQGRAGRGLSRPARAGGGSRWERQRRRPVIRRGRARWRRAVRPGVRCRCGVVRGRCPPGPLRIEGLLLCPGLPAPLDGLGRVRLATRFRRHRAHVARRLHHPRRVSRPHQGGLRRDAGPRELAAGPVLSRRDRETRRLHGGGSSRPP